MERALRADRVRQSIIPIDLRKHRLRRQVFDQMSNSKTSARRSEKTTLTNEALEALRSNWLIRQLNRQIDEPVLRAYRAFQEQSRHARESGGGAQGTFRASRIRCRSLIPRGECDDGRGGDFGYPLARFSTASYNFCRGGFARSAADAYPLYFQMFAGEDFHIAFFSCNLRANGISSTS